jgi:integrase
MINQIDNEKYLSKSKLKRMFELSKTLHPKLNLQKEHNHRNYLIFRLAYLHGMRISEVLDLKWEDIDFSTSMITIRRLKDSYTSNQLMQANEMRELKRLKGFHWSDTLVICKPDGTPLTRQACNKLATKLSELMNTRITPHSMKHTCGVHLALAGKNIREIQHHLGHRDINNTLIYMDYCPTGNANDLI